MDGIVKNSVGFYLFKQNTKRSIRFTPEFRLDVNLAFSNNGELKSKDYFLIFSKISEFFQTYLISRSKYTLLYEKSSNVQNVRLSFKIIAFKLYSLNIIIEYFSKFALLGNKGADILDWKEYIYKIDNKDYKEVYAIKPYYKSRDKARMKNILDGNLNYYISDIGLRRFSTTIIISKNKRL